MSKESTSLTKRKERQIKHKDLKDLRLGVCRSVNLSPWSSTKDLHVDRHC